ncbi:XRE family transcriptional regulator [Nocardia sp. NPDC059228]|uniref:XRE family transcriptional regulator n=1 Tax=Nocardia sp. NPDC059228 TaxID=3346777 RepID=UPI00367ACB4B
MTSRSRTKPGNRNLRNARIWLVAFVMHTIGPAMITEKAIDLLQQARAWSAAGALPLLDHLLEHRDAFFAPSPHAPATLVRLLNLLADNGFDDAVVLLGCAECGRAGIDLDELSPRGRCCQRCRKRLRPARPCTRCGRDGHVNALAPEGPICDSCYAKDPANRVECAGCGRWRRPQRRLDDGTALCLRCHLNTKAPQQCSHCGRLGRTHGNSDKGPVCRTCRPFPQRVCGICGQTRQIEVRANGTGQPDTCRRCYDNIGLCVVCHRHRPGSKFNGRDFHCGSCVPKPLHACGICGERKPAVTTWPVGKVCRHCYSDRLRNPEHCTDCGEIRVLFGIADTGPICASCAVADLDYHCRTCGEETKGYADGRCIRCVINDRIHTLLSTDDGVLVPALEPLAEALTTANPESVASWLAERRSAALLADLVASRAEITHERLDELPQDTSTRRIRDLLITAGILQPRMENLAQIQLWAERTLTGLPGQQQHILRAYAEWHVLRRARRRARKGRYGDGSASGDRARIRVAIDFLSWLEAIDTPMAALTQAHIDEWFDTNPTRAGKIVGFLEWAKARHLIADLYIPKRKSALPQRFQDFDTQQQQLRRCLIDDTLPLDVRVVGALVRLYALPLVRIVELTTDRFHRDSTDAYLTIDRNPVLLPPVMARLIERLIAQVGPDTMISTEIPNRLDYLLPGRPPTRPRNVFALAERLRAHGLPTIAARNTAMMANITDLDAIIVSDLFGIHPSTAHQWAGYAQSSWIHYLAAEPKGANPR